jgi:hypothetical protein
MDNGERTEGGSPSLPILLFLSVPRPSFRLGGAFDFFHHTRAVTPVTDFQPAVRDNGDLVGAL